jgi:hypothetical protein
MVRNAFFLSVLLFGTAFAGCASSGSPEGQRKTAPAFIGGLPSQLHVTNRNWADMSIYAVRSGERVRLMSVTSMRTDSVSIPASLLRSTGFRLMADPVGDRPYYSHTVHPRGGQTVWWTLENHLPQSNIWIY